MYKIMKIQRKFVYVRCIGSPYSLNVRYRENSKENCTLDVQNDQIYGRIRIR